MRTAAWNGLDANAMPVRMMPDIASSQVNPEVAEQFARGAPAPTSARGSMRPTGGDAACAMHAAAPRPFAGQ